MNVDWGSVPDWLSFALAALVALWTYLNRERVARFIRRNVTDPPEIVPPPTITSHLVSRGKSALELRAGGEAGIEVANRGPGTAYGVRVEFPMGTPRLSGQNFVAQLAPGDTWVLPVALDGFTSELRWDVNWTEVGDIPGEQTFSHSFF